MFITNEQLAEHFHKKIWFSQIGGKLGLHEDIVPLIIDSPRVAGPVPGVPYKESFMDGSTPDIVKPDYTQTIEFLINSQNGTWIQQTIYKHEKFQQVTEYTYRWIKVNSAQWEVFLARQMKYPDHLPLGIGIN